MTDPAPIKKRSNTRVIVFLVISLAVLGLSIAMLGRSHNLFSKKVTLSTTYDNVSGLQVGAPVHLAGVNVGMVRKIEFFIDKDGKKRVKVELAVEKSALEHIRDDSVAELSSKGLLGDMLINITIGSVEAEPLKDGDFIPPQPAIGLSHVVVAVEQAIARVSNLTTQLDKSVRETLTPQLSQDLGRIMHATANLTEKIERGDGLIHALVYDKQMTADASQLIAEARQTVTKINTSVGHIEAVLNQVENGDNMIHTLIYDKEGSKLAKDLARAAKELATTVEEIRTGNGMLHSLIYEKDRTNLVQDLAQAAKIIRGVIEEMNQGKGTLGGILKDPTIYQDLKTVLGNIKRNIILKSVIRMTIENDDLKKTGEIKE
ncbi:MAG: MCE family protein [Deltaproteobacteria bacterium]|nr:MCE family protein [Deltaproteobacteria bacterium]